MQGDLEEGELFCSTSPWKCSCKSISYKFYKLDVIFFLPSKSGSLFKQSRKLKVFKTIGPFDHLADDGFVWGGIDVLQ